jgi:ribosomal protein S4E
LIPCESAQKIIEMTTTPSNKLKDGATCKVIGGTHAGKSGIVKDIKTGKTGHVSITVVQANGVRFKTLAKNVEINEPI